MKSLKELQKQEAIERMKMLQLWDTVIEEFEKDGTVNCSQNGGMLFWLNEEQQKMVEKFEDKNNAIVYHVIHNNTEFGELYSLLYISKHKDEWGYDKDDIKNNCALVYVVNKDEESFSEFGSIGIRPQFGGLIRTC